MKQYTDIQGMTFKTLGELMKDSVSKYGDRPFLGVKKDGVYQWCTYAEFGVQVRKFRSILKKEGFKKGDRIGIISNNCPEFAIAVYAAYGLGGVVVPMYEVQKFQDWEYIFGDAQPTVVVVGTDQIREKIESIECEALKKVFVIRAEDESERMSSLIGAETEEIEVEDCVTGDDISDIVYTSGTTGRPRGVELTHHGVVENIKGTAEPFFISKTDRTLAFLPWAHAFGKTIELHIFPSIGAAIGLVESNKTIQQNMLEVNPTILVAVPQIFNRIYDKIHHKLEESKFKKLLFGRAKSVALRVHDGESSILDKLQFSVLDKVVANKVREAFGNSLRFCISGGASLSKEVASFFASFGIMVYEGYGMTEHSPVIAVNTPDCHHIGAVGKPLSGVKVEIIHDNENLDKSDDKCGEVVITSPCIMRKYHNAPEATLEMLDDKGRLHTGDMGYVDDEGVLWITGRVKEQYKLENGKYVVPTALEEKINNSTMINSAVVFGAGRPYNVVLIHPSEDFIKKFKTEHNLENATDAELEKNSDLREMISQELQSTCAEFRGYERPKEFAITLEEFTIQNGLLTPALKIRRRAVEKKYSDVLSGMYK